MQAPAALTYIPAADPAGIEVRDRQARWVASFTTGACTVRLTGPRRSFTEATALRVEHGIWVRTLPEPFAGTVDEDWLAHALEANATGIPDILDLAMQYIDRAPPLFDKRLKIAGDASYGPPVGDTRGEGSDFYDYLGVQWTDPDGKAHMPRHDQYGCLDCSGFMRMTWGYRHSLPAAGVRDQIPLCWTPKTCALPRRAVQMCNEGPGVDVIQNTGKRPRDLTPIKVGDLVFFDADPADGSDIDHVGMYLGRDEKRYRRFISSRKSADGPTLGDFRQRSILDGDRETDLYTRSFRAARRL